MSLFAISKWKKIKRSGGFRRKVNKCYKYILLSNNGVDNQFISSLPCNSPNQNDPNLMSVSNLNPTVNEMRSDADLQLRSDADLQLFSKQNVISNICKEKEEDARHNWIEDIELNSKELCYMLEVEKNAEFRRHIRSWAVSFNVSHLALKSLFKNINNRFPDTLPQDPRSLLKTYQTVVMTKVGNGSYWHHGFELSLRQIFSKVVDIPKTISCNISVDGLPIYKSSKCEFWPILFNIHQLPKLKPMVIGIYCGNGKPSDLTAYLKPFVEEAKILLAEGLDINNVNIVLKLRCFICDSPARAFIEGIQNFNGKHGCTKCTTVGEYFHISHAVYFPRAGCAKRTDEGFRSKIYGTHHKQDTPLELLPIKMIEDFPIGDSLHLIDLGIMKRCLLGWRDDNFGNYKTKWCAKDIAYVSRFLENCKIPAEIHRSVRGVDTLCYWKGTEYRTFLYYLGVVILHDVLPLDVYVHFLKFFCAVTICSSEVYLSSSTWPKAYLVHM